MITVLDTSYLWSLVDRDDVNHQKAVSWIRSKVIGEICILPTVLMEFKAKYNLEFNKLIAAFLIKVENHTSNNLELAEVNVIVEQSFMELSKSGKINLQKLNKYKNSLHEHCRKTFITIKKTKLTKKELKEEFSTLKESVEDKIIGFLKILSEISYEFPDIDGPSINKKATQIIESNIKFDGSGDSMIAGELICLLTSNSDNQYEFVSFDKSFSNLFKNACTEMQIKNINILHLK